MYAYHTDIVDVMAEVATWLAEHSMFANYQCESLRWTGEQEDRDGLMYKTAFTFDWYNTKQIAVYNVATKRMVKVMDYQ
tara:strand:+ start:233 stop:469 length:237 start_codon:yes stop_codon:yes gene_type:complete